MRRRDPRAGFSLTELIIAMLLSSFVLIGIVGISSQMIRFQVEGMKKGTVIGWSLVALTAMNREIENCSVLAYPTTATGSQDYMVACDNYSRLTGAALDGSQPITTIGYCYNGGTLEMRRWTAAGCPAGLPPLPSCDASLGADSLIAMNVYRNGGLNVFARADDVGGLQVRYIVGNPTPTTNMPMAQTMSFDTKLVMNKQYNNTSD